MKYLNKFLFTMKCIVVVAVISGCGDSPLMSHQKPSDKSAAKSQSQDDPIVEEAKSVIEDLRCDLEFNEVGLCAQMTWVKGPQWSWEAEEPMELRLEFWDAETDLRVEPAYELDFDSAMPAMNNHPLDSKPLITQESDSVGTYTVSDIHISCIGGDWHFFFQLKDDGALIDQVRYVWVLDEYLVD